LSVEQREKLLHRSPKLPALHSSRCKRPHERWQVELTLTGLQAPLL